MWINGYSFLLKYAKSCCCVFVDRWVYAIEKNLLDEHKDMDTLYKFNSLKSMNWSL